ncbi:hypothetical protein DYB37_013841 [Aphanomyces astaci]|uniref:Protein kinase domain-containing protein n=1 Tax=Aphanomyces astaci TaxID=112090 RepID=A0A3R6Z9G5_APHAT|nr:hypothetical protein DYB26_007478 [Aphanomyces astaci]RHZ35087.1 hypothetical protein DYB37_013841 [Aphanomyces astaci]
MVYRAQLDTDERGKIAVALKQLLPSRAQKMEHIEHFMHEIRLASTLVHPNIVPFVGFTWSSDLHKFLRAEFAKPPRDKRSSFFTWHGGNDGTPRCTKLSIAANVIDAIAYLHGQTPHSIVHRDLKSKNILLDGLFVAHLADFGVSRLTASECDAVMTARVGTSAWIAPEVLRGDKYSYQADMYSFGVLLAELDTLQDPYKDTTLQPEVAGLSAAKLASKVAHGKITPAFSDSVPPFIKVMATKCLSYDYTARPSAAQVAMELTSQLIKQNHRQSRLMYHPNPAPDLKTPGTSSHAAYTAAAL